MSDVVETTPARRSIGATRNPDSEAAILAAAEAVLLESGLNGFSIEAVAKRARAGKPTIYRWWPSQAALLLDVYHSRKRVNFIYPDTGTIRGDLRAYLSGLLTTWREGTSGEVFRCVVAKAQAEPAALAALSAYMSDRRCQSGKIIEKAQARGEVRADVKPELITELLSSFAWGRLLTERLDVPEDEIDAIVDTVLSGIALKPVA
ncbi:TetR/AcrR family transcriptional regulator [Shinella curvata]|uniref:TetR/AcrR family transcriptional regulator n=1 Tax=Shinella curvata TaxID=1817964 RepID=A0ABT8XCT7_9HYPH|nr:TetR/AcrR family transcriptional regulator [Shinella curvata]MCJ8054533.1 TetR/AcrR family transcriptional regulator [Shinella curvata]MDO6121554.1 TetR/AcrR family transcriptional regulator [Shinella curvata]